MLEYRVSKNGELLSGKDKDLILQTSKGIDTIKVYLPEDYNDDNIVASITFKNPKNVNSNEYKMEHIEGSKVLTYLLDDAWFSSVKGTMAFTIRVYSTDATKEDSVTIDPETGDIIAGVESKVQVFTKGSYQILEAIEKGFTPEIPKDDMEKIYTAITTRATKLDIYNYVEKLTGIGKFATDQPSYENINYRLRLVEQDLQDESDVIERATEVYLQQDKTIDIGQSDKPLTIVRKNSIKGNADIAIKLPIDVVSIDMDTETQIPVVTESVFEADKATSDRNGNIIDETYVTNNTIQDIYAPKSFNGGINSNGISLTSSEEDEVLKRKYAINIINNHPYGQIMLTAENINGDFGRVLVSLTDGMITFLPTNVSQRVEFFLKDLVTIDKVNRLFKKINIYVNDSIVATDVMPFIGERNILFVLNNQICVCKVTLTKDSGNIEQIYGPVIDVSALKLITSSLGVGDLNE